MSSDLTIFFLFFGGLQGILFSLFLFRKKLHHSGYFFLLLYFMVMLLQITLKLMSKGWLMHNWTILYELSYQLPFLYGPLIYLFTKQILLRQTFQWSDLLHFIPFAIVVFFFLVGYSYAESPMMLFPFLLAKSRLLLQLVSLYLYHWLSRQCWLEKNQSGDKFSFVQHFQFQWLKKFIYASFFICISISVLNYFMVVLYPDLNYIRPGFLIITLFIYWISYEALYHPEVFSVIKGYAGEAASATEDFPKLTVHLPTKKYLKSNLDEEQAGRILNNLQSLMQCEKPYLDPAINIDRLAAIIGTNRHHLSQVLNEKLKKSFNDFINQYRVDEAKMLLTDPARISHKIASIAYDSGFNSLSTFNDVFRKSVGVTPSQFRKQPVELSQKKRV
jgi:AraC-like DNA-binding protein